MFCKMCKSERCIHIICKTDILIDYKIGLAAAAKTLLFTLCVGVISTIVSYTLIAGASAQPLMSVTSRNWTKLDNVVTRIRSVLPGDTTQRLLLMDRGSRLLYSLTFRQTSRPFFPNEILICFLRSSLFFLGVKYSIFLIIPYFCFSVSFLVSTIFYIQ